MQVSSVISMMKRRDAIALEDLASLAQLADEHPWCATFQLLKTCGYKDTDDMRFKPQLNLAAAYAGDRSKLYEYVIRRKVTESFQPPFETPAPFYPPDGSTTDQAPVVINPPTETEQVKEPLGKEILEIDSEPLEEQIMRAAIMQIGELEITQNFSLEKETVPDSAPRNQVAGSFGDWLLKLDRRSTGGINKTPPEKALIEKFIQESPQISPVKKAFFSPSQMGKLSLVEDESFVSETLAKIYERQGDYKKAARAYQNLLLKYPEKSSYFAALQKQAEAHLKNS